jgi:hypothetical protein
LTEQDRTPAPDPAVLAPIVLRTPKPSGSEERVYLLEAVIIPLMVFSLEQEAAISAERSRSEAIVSKVDALNAAQSELTTESDAPRRIWPFVGFWRR